MERTKTNFGVYLTVVTLHEKGDMLTNTSREQTVRCSPQLQASIRLAAVYAYRGTIQLFVIPANRLSTHFALQRQVPHSFANFRELQNVNRKVVRTSGEFNDRRPRAVFAKSPRRITFTSVNECTWRRLPRSFARVVSVPWTVADCCSCRRSRMATHSGWPHVRRNTSRCQ